jgi:hypothetical protein
MTTISTLIEADCATLILRALLSKSVVAFGDDGLGKYGRSQIPRTFLIHNIDVDVECDDQTGDDATCTAKLYLEGFHKDDVGHVATDQNLLISLRQHLKDAEIDPSCIRFADYALQGDDYCTLHFDVQLLLQWS